MTVYIANADKDRRVADSLSKFLKGRSLLSEKIDLSGGLKTVAGRDVVLLLWSNALSADTRRPQMAAMIEKKAQENKLVTPSCTTAYKSGKA